MTEIKSTLDLIMEKTRDLLPSEEEKKALLEKEWAGKIRGLVQRVLDGRMTPEALRSGFSSSPPPPPGINPDALLKRELLGKIDPDEDNGRILHLLETICGEDTGELNRGIAGYLWRVEEKKAALSAVALEDLASRGITGAAVSPNLDSHEAFRSFLERERETFRRRLVL